MAEDRTDPWSAMAFGGFVAALGGGMLADIVAAYLPSPPPPGVPESAMVMPSPVIPVPFALVALLLVTAGLGVFGSGVVAIARAGTALRLPSRTGMAKVAAILALLVLFPLLLPVAGFVVSMSVLCAGAGLVYQPHRPTLVIPLGILTALMLYLIGTQVLGADLSWATGRS